MMSDLAIILLLIAGSAALFFLCVLAMFLLYAKRTHYYLRLLRDRWDARVLSFPDWEEIVFLNIRSPEDYEDAMHTLELLRYYAPSARTLAYCVRISFLVSCLAGALSFIAFSAIV